MKTPTPPAFSAGRHVSRSLVGNSLFYRVEWIEAWSDELGVNTCMTGAEVRAMIDGSLDVRGCAYRIFPMTFTPCAATNR